MCTMCVYDVWHKWVSLFVGGCRCHQTPRWDHSALSVWEGREPNPELASPYGMNYVWLFFPLRWEHATLISVGIWGLSRKLNSTERATEATCQSRAVLSARMGCERQPVMKVWESLLSPLPRVTKGIGYCASRSLLRGGTAGFWPSANFPFPLHLEVFSFLSWFWCKEGAKGKQWNGEKGVFVLPLVGACLDELLVWLEDLKTSFFFFFPLFLTSIREFLTSLVLQ